MEHIQTIELGSSQASIEFTSIPQDYDDLVLVVSGRSARTGNIDALAFFINGSSANLSSIELMGNNGGTVTSRTRGSSLGYINGNSTTSNTFSNSSFYFSNYTASQNKSISAENVTETNSADGYTQLLAGLWSNNSAITSIEFDSANGKNLLTGTTASLYGVTAGGDGTVTSA